MDWKLKVGDELVPGRLIQEPLGPPHAKAPSRVASVLMACLERDPAKRPSPLEVFDAFDDLAARHGRKRRRLTLR